MAAIACLLIFTATLNGVFAYHSANMPEQVHIAYGDDPTTEMTVTWSTKEDPESPAMVYYGRQVPDRGVQGTSTKFVDGGRRKRSQYIHTVKLTGLRPQITYLYRCGSGRGWSNEYSFTTANASTESELKLAAYGDMGYTNARAFPSLLAAAKKGEFQTVLHVGDFAYDFHSRGGKLGDKFMRLIEPLAANIPYMVCPGNHEKAYNFSHYRGRFAMPGQSENLYYSYNLGPVHFISLNTEAYYFLEYGIKLLTNQYDWLEQDLKEATKPENRQLRPWIVAYGHKPMYCSNTGSEDCTYNTTRTRIGFPGFEMFGLEKLFYEYGVDLALWGHEHSYERLWPLYDYQVKNGSNEHPYVNPKATVHITSGSAGSNEFKSYFPKTTQPWSAARSSQYGYLTLHFHNRTHLYLRQVDVENNEIDDEIWIVKDEHKSFL